MGIRGIRSWWWVVAWVLALPVLGCDDENRISLSASSVAFIQDYGVASDEQVVTIHFVGDGLVAGYAPGVEPAAWLQLGLPDMPVAAGTGLRLGISPDLLPGDYATSVRVATGNLDGSDLHYADLAVSATVRDVVTVTIDKPVIGGRAGSDELSNTATISVTKYGAWTARIDPPVAALSASSGTEQQLITVTAVPGLSVGHHPATVTIEGGGQAGHVDLDVAIDGPRWWTDRQAVALTQTASQARLTDTVQLHATVALASLGLTVFARATWLVAQITDGALILTADPSGLPDGLQLGEVVLTPADPDLAPLILRVSLYKQSTAVAAQSTIPVLRGHGVTPFGIVMDPLRPIVYVGADAGGAIEGYNVYTGGQIVSTQAPQAHQVPWRVTPDGRSLITRSYDVARATWGDVLIAYDLDARTWGAPSTAPFPEAIQTWNVDGVELAYDHGFIDAAGNRYDNMSDDDSRLSPFSQLFGDPSGEHWAVLQYQGYNTYGGRIVFVDQYSVHVFPLARKLYYSASSSMSYDTEPPLLGVPSTSPPPVFAALRSRDGDPQSSGDGTTLWASGGIYPVQLRMSMTGFPPYFLNYPTGAQSAVQGLSVSRNGEAVAIWPGEGGNGTVVARYKAGGQVTSEPLSSGLAGGASLSATIQHAADDLRVVTVRDPATAGGNTIGLMNH